MPTRHDAPALTHVQFVPFEMHDRGDKVLVGRVSDNDWIVLDPSEAEIMAVLDRGASIDDAAELVAPPDVSTPDVLALVNELDAIGFVAAMGERTSGNRVAVERRRLNPWAWRALEGSCAAALVYVVWALLSGHVPMPAPADLLLGGVGLGAGLAILTGTAAVTSALHELAHVVVGRWYGLDPRVRVHGCGLWAVARTDLAGVWALERSLRWRPIAAGLMVDVAIVAGAVAAFEAAAPSTLAADLARLVIATVACRMVWQAQWYLRTDLYFLFTVVTGSLNLQETARLWMRRTLLRGDAGRRAATELDAVPASEVAAARLYWLALPLSLLASAALWWWMLVPLLRRIVGDLG
jgi:hypothetical protein